MTEATPWFEEVPLDFDRSETQRALAILAEIYPTSHAVLQAIPHPTLAPAGDASRDDLLKRLMTLLQRQGRLQAWLVHAQAQLLRLFPAAARPEEPAPLDNGLRVVTDGPWSVRDLERVLHGLDGLYAARLLADRVPTLDARTFERYRQKIAPDEQLHVHQIRAGERGAIEVIGVREALSTVGDVLIRAAKMDYLALPAGAPEDAINAVFDTIEDSSEGPTTLEGRPAADMLEPLVREVVSAGRGPQTDDVSTDLELRITDFFDAVGAVADGQRIQAIERVREGETVASSEWTWNQGEDAHGRFAETFVEGARLRLRLVPAGAFTMGAAGRQPLEGPPHVVTLSEPFWLADTPVTQALFHAVVDQTPSYFAGPEHPVEQIDWAEAMAFVAAVNARLPGARFTLPTEAQWEHACRAGSGEREPTAVWHRGRAGGTRPVTAGAPNAWGLFDMLGNVYEWTRDGLGWYGAQARTDPVRASTDGVLRVVRGGSWFSPEAFCHPARRHVVRSTTRTNDLGLRLCIEGETLPGPSGRLDGRRSVVE